MLDQLLVEGISRRLVERLARLELSQRPVADRPVNYLVIQVADPSKPATVPE